MKNKLESWEEGLAGQMKEHEFSFDPDALAGFESLLAAETAVSGGETTPGNQAAPTAPAGRGWASGKLMGWLLVMALGGALLFYYVSGPTSEPNSTPLAVPTTPEWPTTEVPTPEVVLETADISEPVVTALPDKPSLHPAAPPPAAATEPVELIGGTPPAPQVFAPSTELPRPMPTSGIVNRQQPRVSVFSVATLPFPPPQMVAPLRPRALPVVSIILEPVRATRDRKALFPEVIDRHK